MKPPKLKQVPKVSPDAVYAANEAARRDIAKRQLMNYMDAVSHCGTGAEAYGRWRIVDRSGAVPDRFVYVCQRAGQGGWLPAVPEDGEQLRPPFKAQYCVGPRAQDPGFFIFRFEKNFEYIELYEPGTAEELKKAAEKRRTKVIAQNAQAEAEYAAWAARNVTPSLFGDTVAESQSDTERG